MARMLVRKMNEFECFLMKGTGTNPHGSTKSTHIRYELHPDPTYPRVCKSQCWATSPILNLKISFWGNREKAENRRFDPSVRAVGRDHRCRWGWRQSRAGTPRAPCPSPSPPAPRRRPSSCLTSASARSSAWPPAHRVRGAGDEDHDVRGCPAGVLCKEVSVNLEPGSERPGSSVWSVELSRII